jgi:hemerythrin-like domain-containing protein
MEIIETLMDEHRQIERGLDALETYLLGVKAGESAERATVAKFATFLREFADRIHHGKEEDLLFARMVENGFPKESGPVAVMLYDHEEGRALVRRLREIGDSQGSVSAEERQDAVAAGLGFAQLLRNHIHKEDRILYPMSETHLPEEVQSGLDRDAAALDATRQAQIESMQQLLTELEMLAGERPMPDYEPEDCAAMGCSACKGG